MPYGFALYCFKGHNFRPDDFKLYDFLCQPPLIITLHQIIALQQFSPYLRLSGSHFKCTQLSHFPPSLNLLK